MSKYDILFIGTAIVDSIIRGFDPEPVSATGYRAESGSLHIGGEAVNGSITAAKLGMKTAILCALGNDAAGDMIENALTAYGVDTGLIVRSDDHPTPVTTMFVAEDGSRKSITNKAHRYNFHPEQYMEALSDTREVVLGSLFRAPFDDPAVARQVVAAASERDVLIFADTKLPNFTKRKLEDYADSLPLIDCITPNEDEARYCSGEDDPEKMAEAFLDAGVRSVIIKLGGKGCFFKSREESLYLPPYEIEAVDASGAGDNFLAGYVSEVLRGSSVRSALTFANACGALCTTAVGACTALRDRQQVEEWVRSKSRS
ncbi:MAG: carbohydrate kinase family protein [Firmicutes bacterium]|nr:carbohydrate kinase family protein [Bacillota bacterium]